MLLQTGQGNFTGEYLVTEYDLDMKFLVGAAGERQASLPRLR